MAVALLEPNEGFMSCPWSVLYIAGHQPASDFQRSYKTLDDLGVRRVRERATGIDSAPRAVATATQKLAYGFLRTSCGCQTSIQSD